MRYTATIYGWNEGQEPQQLQVLDSATYTPIPGKQNDCAFEAARDAVFMYLDKDWDNCRIDLHSEAGEGDKEVPEDSSLFYGAFTHPVRGRILFAAGDCGFDNEVGYSLELLEDTRKKKMAEADIPIYSPNQLYAMKPLHKRYDESWSLVEHYLRDFFPMNNYLDNAGYDKIDKQKRIQVRYLAHIGLGSDESWTLATLWFKPDFTRLEAATTDEYLPVAVLTYQGEDYEYEALITNMQLLGDLVAFIQKHMPMEHRNIVDPDQPMEKYTEFWGHKLADFYDVESGLPVKPHSLGKNQWGNEMTEWQHYGLWGDGVKYAPEKKNG